MAYTKRPDLTPTDGLIVQLVQRLLPNGDPDPSDQSGGELVLVQQRVKAIQESLCPSIQVTATWVDELMQPIVDAQGRHKAFVDFKHAASQYQQDTLGVPAIVRECLMLVLGEQLTMAPPPDPPSENPDMDATTLIPWDGDLVRSNDIRRAITIAKASLDVDLDQVL